MIFKTERADGTVNVSGSIESCRDFKKCLAGCTEKKNFGGKEIISEFADKNGEKFREYLEQAEKDFIIQQEKKRIDALGEN